MKKINKEGLRSEKGFTMIELIIVIAILGILAAILVPSFAQMTRKSRLNADINTVRNAQTQLELYIAEKDGMYPDKDGKPTNTTGTGPVMVQGLYKAEYIKESDMNDKKEDIEYQSKGIVTEYKDDQLKLNVTKLDKAKFEKIVDSLSKKDQEWVEGTPGGGGDNK